MLKKPETKILWLASQKTSRLSRCRGWNWDSASTCPAIPSLMHPRAGAKPCERSHFWSPSHCSAFPSTFSAPLFQAYFTLTHSDPKERVSYFQLFPKISWQSILRLTWNIFCPWTRHDVQNGMPPNQWLGSRSHPWIQGNLESCE